MKKVLLGFSVLGIVLSGCSNKKLLEGIRKDVTLSRIQKEEMDNSPVVLDQSYEKLGRKFQLQWANRMKYGSSKSLRMAAPALVKNGKVFCLDAGGLVYAFDAKNGNLIWSKTTTLKGKDGQIGGALACGEGKLIVTSSFAEAFAFDENTGKMLWRIKLPTCCKGDGITISDGNAYMLCDNSSLQVIDVNNGNLLWFHNGMMMDTTYVGSSNVCVKGGIVYLSYPSGEVFALLRNGSVLWNAMLSRFSFINADESLSHPRACSVIKDNLIYFTSANRQITAFDTRSGIVVWKKNHGGLETPLVSGNSIFILNSSSDLVCLNKDSGRIRWSRKLELKDDTNCEWFGPIQIGNELLMTSSSGSLLTVSAIDGSIKPYRVDIEQKIISRPIISDNMMYLITEDGSVLAYK